MQVTTLPFEKTGYFSSLICDYLDRRPQLDPFYHRFPSLDQFEAQIKEKAQNYNDGNRSILYDSLIGQYRGLSLKKKVRNNLAMLKEPNTFTVVTGHQLNLFTGPLYFVYKIVTTINLTHRLKKEFPKYNFVPVYWMATEDHDFEEIDHFNLNGKKIRWNKKGSGAVGRMETEGLESVFEVFSNELGHGDHAETLRDLFTKAYLEHNTLAMATRYLVDRLFGEEGLVIVDGDDPKLKSLLMPYAEKDIFENNAFAKVSNTITSLESISDDYKIQVNPREINYFYLKEGIRERLVFSKESYKVNGTDIQFDEARLRQEINANPERFSPNVVARPLYQEVILPNLCYIGGGGELAYWLELRSSFDAMGVTFPMLLLRNSVLVVNKKQQDKLERLNMTVTDMFLPKQPLINKKVRQISDIEIDFSPQKKHLEDQFAQLYELAEQTDKSFLGAVAAQEKKQKRGLDNLEKRFLKAQKRKLSDHVERLTEIKDRLFPNGSLQERAMNFSELYLEYGPDFIPMLLKYLDPLKNEFYVLRY